MRRAWERWMSETIPGDLQTEIEKLRTEVQDLTAELHAVRESPFLQSSVKNIVYEVSIDREEVVSKELGQRINEKHGTMFEIKNQAKRFAYLLGLDADTIRLMVTEALQNVIEHGFGKYAEVRFELRNEGLNPCLVSSFKHEMPPGERYTLSDINRNALKADISSEFFDFESSRGRGEFIMKQLTDERRVINGIELDRDGRKIHYFKRLLINYRDPSGPRDRVTFSELKEEIDRLDYDDVVCCFHVDFRQDSPEVVTIACVKNNLPRVAAVMLEYGLEVIEQENYYRTVFASFRNANPAPVPKDQLLEVFAKVKQVVYEEAESRGE